MARRLAFRVVRLRIIARVLLQNVRREAANGRESETVPASLRAGPNLKLVSNYAVRCSPVRRLNSCLSGAASGESRALFFPSSRASPIHTARRREPANKTRHLSNCIVSATGRVVTFALL